MILFLYDGLVLLAPIDFEGLGLQFDKDGTKKICTVTYSAEIEIEKLPFLRNSFPSVTSPPSLLLL